MSKATLSTSGERSSVIKSEIPEEELSRSFMVLEVKSLVLKKPLVSQTCSFYDGNVKNFKKFRKQSIAKANQTFVPCTAVESPLNKTNNIFDKAEPDREDME